MDRFDDFLTNLDNRHFGLFILVWMALATIISVSLIGLAVIVVEVLLH